MASAASAMQLSQTVVHTVADHDPVVGAPRLYPSSSSMGGRWAATSLAQREMQTSQSMI